MAQVLSMGLRGERSQEQNQTTLTVSLGQVHRQLNVKWAPRHPCPSVIPGTLLSQELVHQASQDSAVCGPHRHLHASKERSLHCESGRQRAGSQKEPLEGAVLLSVPTPTLGAPSNGQPQASPLYVAHCIGYEHGVATAGGPRLGLDPVSVETGSV